MARARFALVLGAIQAVLVESNFLYNAAKSAVCGMVNVPLVCSGSDSNSGSHGSNSGNSGGFSNSGSSSKCSGGSCCAESSCYSLPGMGCDASRGACHCLGASLPFTAGQCQCANGASCSEGTCAPSSGGSGMMGAMMEDLFEENKQVVRVPSEDHSRALALYTGGACLLVVAGLSAGVRKLRHRGSSEGAGDGEAEPRWDLLSQVSSSGE